MHLSGPHSEPQGASDLVGVSGEHRLAHTHTQEKKHPPTQTLPHTHALIVLSLTTNLLTTIGQRPFFVLFTERLQ